MSEAPSESAEGLAYFRAIEECFIGLRGAPLLLSPADYRVARDWQRRGLPLEAVLGGLEEFFRGRRERGLEGRVNSLRYCAPAVERFWKDLSELAGPGRRSGEASPAMDLGARLSRLSRSLQRAGGAASAVSLRLKALTGGPQEVERQLEALDRELLEAIERDLGSGEVEELETRVELSLRALGRRLSPEERLRVAADLRRRLLRKRAGLPLLSLFSPEAREAARGEDEETRNGD